MRKYITSDPEVMGGQPVIRGTRIPVSRVIYLLKNGYTLEAIHEEYDWVSLKTIEGVIDEVMETINNTLHAKKVSQI